MREIVLKLYVNTYQKSKRKSILDEDRPPLSPRANKNPSGFPILVFSPPGPWPG
jgi:hypothetical protein